MSVYEDTVFSLVRNAEKELTNILNADIFYYNASIGMQLLQGIRDTIEALSQFSDKKSAIAIFLTTPGGEAEAAAKFVEIIRYHYKYVYFIVPVAAMSAGTILCMAGDKIYMDYYSSLGPIDPQVLDKEGKKYVPALGYLDQMYELIEKSRNGTITPAEFQWIQNQDWATLRFYEQARELSIDLLKDWLVKYKFRNWIKHRTKNPGTEVTSKEKEERAKEIGRILSDNKQWHTHRRMIGLQALRDICHLEIEDFGKDSFLQKQIRLYSDLLSDYKGRLGNDAFAFAAKLSKKER